MTTHKKYDHELKVAAARDVVEGGVDKPRVMEKYGIASIMPLNNWCRAYREGGPDALLPKPKGRPRKPEKPVYASREGELEARVRELELEIQKRINALVIEGRYEAILTAPSNATRNGAVQTMLQNQMSHLVPSRL